MTLSRRDFLKRLAALGLVAASPKIIFDMGKNAGTYNIDGGYEMPEPIIYEGVPFVFDGGLPYNGRLYFISKQSNTFIYTLPEP